MARGTETLKLQNATSLKDLDNYTSTGQDYAKVVLNYPSLYDKIMSTARGLVALLMVRWTLV